MEDGLFRVQVIIPKKNFEMNLHYFQYMVLLNYEND